MTPDTRGLSGAPALALDQILVFANQQLQVRLLFLGEFHEDLLAFGILESLAVFPEEAMRASLAADADHERLLVIDAFRQAFGSFREQAVRRALEKQKRGSRFQQRIRGQQLRISRFERTQMLLLFPGQFLKYAAAARVFSARPGPSIGCTKK